MHLVGFFWKNKREFNRMKYDHLSNCINMFGHRTLFLMAMYCLDPLRFIFMSLPLLDEDVSNELLALMSYLLMLLNNKIK